MQNTQDPRKELHDAQAYFWEILKGDTFNYPALTEEVNRDYVQALKRKVLDALEDTYNVFWYRMPEDPQPGEWWLLGTSGEWVVEPKKVVQALGEDRYLVVHRSTYYIEKHSKFICRLPPSSLSRFLTSFLALFRLPVDKR